MTIRYVDPSDVQGGTGWDGVDGNEYTGTPGVGVGYSTFEAAELARVAGDKVYLRGGTYTENWGGTQTVLNGPATYELDPALNGTSWDEGSYNYIGSYPGEWAILDCGAELYGLGYGQDSWNSGAKALSYWRFEKLEIKNAVLGGIAVNKGPIHVKYCYIHDNKQGTGDNNPAGLRSFRLENSLIEYSAFYDNGGVSVANNNCAQIVIFADYLYTSDSFDIDNCNKQNTIRYNNFDSSGYVYCGIKDKAPQNLAEDGETGAITDMTYSAYGNKVHNNIVKNTNIAIMSRQYFQQVYKNISDGGRVTGEDGSTTRAIYNVCSYNNTILNNYMSVCIANNLSYPDIKLDWFAENNIISNFGTADQSPSVGIAVFQCFGATCDAGTSTYDWTDTSVDYNMVYQPLSATQHFGLPASYSDKSTLWIDTDAFNTARTATNYTTNTAGLFVGATGTDIYKIDPDFAFDSTTAGTAGSGSTHPYLAGVTLPTYLGAVNPDDDNWVDGVEGLDVSYLTSVEAGSTPSWVEGAAATGNETSFGSGSTTFGSGTTSFA